MLPVLLVLSSLLGAPHAANKPKPRLAVLDVDPLVGVTAALAKGVTAALVVAVRQRAADSAVISTDEIKAMLDTERERQKLGCSDAACLAEIGGALGATRLVTGSLGKLGDTFVFTVKLIDVRRALVLAEASENLKGVGDDALLDAVKRVTARLFPRATGEDDLVVTTQDLWGDGPPANRGVDHGLGLVLAGVSLAAAAVAVVGFVEVASFNGKADQWNRALSQSQPPGVTAADAKNQQSAANVWQAVAFAGIGVAAVGAGAAVLTW